MDSTRIGNTCLNLNLALDYRKRYAMKRLIKKISNKLLYHTRWFRNYWGGVQKFWNLREFNLDVVNLGSNSGKFDFDYSEVPLSGMNWAVGPQSLLHDYNILKNYFSYLKDGATILIVITPFSSLFSPYTKESNLKYYTFLHPATILDFDDSERTRALKIRDYPLKEIPSYCIKQTIKEVIGMVSYHKMKKCNFEEHALSFINMWRRQFGINNFEVIPSAKHLMEQESRAKTLSEMIDFCLERGFNPVLVVPPIYKSLADKLTPICRQNYMYNFIEKANSKKIRFLDYIDDERFQEEEYFMNSFFMSARGAKLFTRTLLHEIGLI